MTETVQEKFERKRKGYWRYVKRMKRINPLWGKNLPVATKMTAFLYYGLREKIKAGGYGRLKT